MTENIKVFDKIFLSGFLVLLLGFFLNFRIGNTLFPSLTIVYFLLAGIVNYKNISLQNLKKTSAWIFIVFPLIFAVLEVFNGQFVKDIHFLERFTAWMIIPIIIFSYKKWNTWKVTFIQKSFVILNVIFILLGLGRAFFRLSNYYPKEKKMNWYYFYRYDFWDFIQQHPVYMSFSILMAFALVLFQKKLFDTYMRFFIIMILFFGIVISGSRTGYLSLFLIIIFYFIYTINQNGFDIKHLIFGLAGMLALILLFQIPIIKERVYGTLGVKYKYQFYMDNKQNKTKKTKRETRRFELWKDSWNVIKQDFFVPRGFNKGLEDIYQQYKQAGHQYFLNKQYNSHNTFLSIWIYGGIIWLVNYLLIFFVLIKKSILSRSPEMAVFALLFILFSLSETLFLLRGIILISFLYSFLLIRFNPNTENR